MLKRRLFTIELGSYRFSPGLIPTVVTLLLLYLLFSLGQWQLSRAQFKESLKQQIIERGKITAVDIELLPGDEDKKQFRQVNIKGTFDSERNFLLDNRVMNQQAGYEVITPFKTVAGKWLLINRGWIPRTKYRTELPVFETPEGMHVLSGFIRTPNEKVFMLQEQVYDLRQWPVIIQSINIREITKVLGLDLESFVVFLNQNSAAGFDRHWPAYKLDSEKHIGYAVQWFALFSALVAIYFLVNTKRSKDDE